MEIPNTGIYVPTDSMTFEFQGRPVIWIRRRTTIQAGHPILRGRMHLVEPLKLDWPVEKKTGKIRETAAA